MQLIPPHAEYLSLLALLLLLAVAVFLEEIKFLTRTASFWAALLITIIFGTLFDLLALHLQWWSFSEEQVLGIYVAAVPAEELGLFALIYLLAICAWES